MKTTAKGLCFGIKRMCRNLPDKSRDEFIDAVNQHAHNTYRRIRNAINETEFGDENGRANDNI